jgi:hypothetical protein
MKYFFLLLLLVLVACNSASTPTPEPTEPSIVLSSSVTERTNLEPFTLSAEVKNFSATKVEFYQEAELIGSDETAPYTLTTDDNRFGSYTNNYTAKASNAAAETISSSVLVITTNVVTNLLLSPENPIILAGGPVTSFEAYLQTEGDSDSVSVQWSLEGPGSLSVTEGERTEYTPPATLAAETTATVTATLPDGRSGRSVITLRPATPGDSLYFVSARVFDGTDIYVTESSTGTPFPSAIVKVNGTTIPFGGGRFQGSIADIAPGETVELEITVPEGTISGSVTMPSAPDITAPAIGSSVSAANPLTLSWDIVESPANYRLGYGTDPYESALAVFANAVGSSRSYSFTDIPANKTLNLYVMAINETTSFTGPVAPGSGLYAENYDPSSSVAVTTTP